MIQFKPYIFLYDANIVINKLKKQTFFYLLFYVYLHKKYL